MQISIMGLTPETLRLLGGLLVLVISMCIFLYLAVVSNAHSKQMQQRQSKQHHRSKGVVDRLNHNDLVQSVGGAIPSGHLEMIFNRAKNPWHMNIYTFQCIRYGGLAICTVAGALAAMILPWQVTFIILASGFICWYYPMYFYTAIGKEREAEWNKLYEFIWVIKNNLMLYDPAKSYMNVRIYIEQHAPHDKELIQGFEDFYRYWNDDHIDPYIDRYYPFSIPREIVQIVFNMTKTGEFPEEQLNSIRQFIINTQDLGVERVLSGVSSKATIFSLPFLMVTVIVCLMVPLLVQILRMI